MCVCVFVSENDMADDGENEADGRDNKRMRFFEPKEAEKGARSSVEATARRVTSDTDSFALSSFAEFQLTKSDGKCLE